MAVERERLRDRYGRLVNSLRISLTQRCNFDCFFCHKEGEANPQGELTAADFESIAAAASDLGIRRIKLTGGEPLMRVDIVEIVRRIAPYAEEVSMTTNASLLAEMALSLREAGLKRVNVSLHSAKPEVFQRITGHDALAEVERGIKAAIDSDVHPVKLNMVVMNGINAHEIPDMIEFSKEVGAILQLIEFQPIGWGASDWSRFHCDLRPIEEKLMKRSVEIRERELHRRKQYRLEGGGLVEVVRPMHNSEFCRFCTRLRVTSDGRLKPCLMRNDNLVDVAPLIRRGAPRSALEDAFKEAVAKREPFWRD